MVVTSAKWLANVIQLMPYGNGSIPSGVEWRLKHPDTKFHVIVEGPMRYRNQPHTLPSPLQGVVGRQPVLTRHDQIQPTLTKTDHSPAHNKGLVVFEADILSVHLLRGVHGCLLQQLQALSQWRCELGGGRSEEGEGRGRGREEGGGDLVSVETLLLPLSCAVFLRLRGGGGGGGGERKGSK